MPSDVDANKTWGNQIGSSVVLVPAITCIITFKPIKHQSGASSLTAVYANLFLCAGGTAAFLWKSISVMK